MNAIGHDLLVSLIIQPNRTAIEGPLSLPGKIYGMISVDVILLDLPLIN
jgi:hypothetical protein